MTTPWMKKNRNRIPEWVKTERARVERWKKVLAGWNAKPIKPIITAKSKKSLFNEKAIKAAHKNYLSERESLKKKVDVYGILKIENPTSTPNHSQAEHNNDTGGDK